MQSLNANFNKYSEISIIWFISITFKTNIIDIAKKKLRFKKEQK